MPSIHARTTTYKLIANYTRPLKRQTSYGEQPADIDVNLCHSLLVPILATYST